MLIGGSRFSIPNTSSNSNPKSKRLQQLRKWPMPNRFIFKKSKNSSHLYRNDPLMRRAILFEHGRRVDVLVQTKTLRPGNWSGRSSGGSGKVWQWSNSLAEPGHWEAGQLPCPGQAHATHNPTIITFQFLIQGAKRMRILVRICRHQKLDSDIKKYTLCR